MSGLPLVARVYISAMWLVSVVVIASAFWVPFDWQTLAVLMGAYLLAERAANLSIRRSISVSVSPAIALAGILLLPPSAAALVVLPVVAASPVPRPPIQRLFNASMFVCAAAAAGLLYEALGGRHEFASGSFPYLPQAFAAEIAYCLLNGLFLAVVLRTTEGVPLLTVWRSALGSTILPYLGYGLFGVIIAVLWQSDSGKVSALLVLLPLYVARWTFALYSQEQEAYNATVAALVQAVDTKDHYTRGHSERVGRASTMIARKRGMADDRSEALYFAGILHDVGKLGVPSRVLQKDGPLTEDEYEAMKFHPMHGLEMVRGIGFLREASDGILHHHERVDGRGYPLGLKGEEIPEFARIIGVADAFDCMTSTRSYRQAATVEEAIAELRRCAGAQFDPSMVEAMEAAVEDEGWEIQAIPPPPADVAATVSRYDHDDPTVQIPVIPADAVPKGGRR